MTIVFLAIIFRTTWHSPGSPLAVKKVDHFSPEKKEAVQYQLASLQCFSKKGGTVFDYHSHLVVVTSLNAKWARVSLPKTTIAPITVILSAYPKNVGISVPNLKRLRRSAGDITLRSQFLLFLTFVVMAHLRKSDVSTPALLPAGEMFVHSGSSFMTASRGVQHRLQCRFVIMERAS